MTRSTVFNVVSIGIAVFGIALATYQGIERKKLKEFMRSEAWYLYQKASNSNGQTQKAFELYKQAHAESMNMRFVESLAKADAFGQDVTKETIRQIQLSEPEFTREKIEAWVQLGKLSAQHRSLFEQLCTEDKLTANK